jgi:hypothetical protein
MDRGQWYEENLAIFNTASKLQGLIPRKNNAGEQGKQNKTSTALCYLAREKSLYH